MARHSKKMKVSLISALLVFGLATGPVQANHDSHRANVLAPLAAFIVLGSILRHNHGHAYKYSKRRYGHHQNSGRHSHQSRNYSRSRSYSHEGYNRSSKRIYRH